LGGGYFGTNAKTLLLRGKGGGRVGFPRKKYHSLPSQSEGLANPSVEEGGKKRNKSVTPKEEFSGTDSFPSVLTPKKGGKGRREMWGTKGEGERTSNNACMKKVG